MRKEQDNVPFFNHNVFTVAGVNRCRRTKQHPVEFKFFTWQFQISLLTLISYSALIGGGVIAVLTLPKLVSKSFRVRRLHKEIYELKKKAVDLEKHHEEES